MSEAEPTLEVSYEEKKQVRNPWVPAVEASSDNIGNESDDSVTSPAPISKPARKDKQKKAKRKEMQGPTVIKLSSATMQFIEGQATAEDMVQLRWLLKRQADLEQERLEIELMLEKLNKERADIKQKRFEIELMMGDLNKYTPNRKKYLRDKRKEILQRHAARNISENDDA